MEAVREDIHKTFRDVEAFATVVDPETQPYASKYAARELLVALRRRLVKFEADERASLALAQREEVEVAIAQVDSRLGANLFLTEETTSCERHLLDAVDVTRRYFEAPVPPAPLPTWSPAYIPFLEAACACIEGCNYLALLYAGWDKHPRALRFLRVAKAVYRAVAGRKPDVGGTTTGAAAADDKPAAGDAGDATAAVAAPPAVRAGALLRQVDSLFTLTCFYYAQVYSRLGAASESALYVETTLRRQLAEQQKHARAAAAAGAVVGGGDAAAAGAASSAPDVIADLEGLPPVSTASAASPSLDRVEWIRNALRLSDYYAMQGRMRPLVQCLAAADIVLSQAMAAEVAAEPATATTAVVSVSSMPDALQRLSAEVAVAWGRAYVDVMREARDRLGEAEEEEPKAKAGGGAASSDQKRKPLRRRYDDVDAAYVDSDASDDDDDDAGDDSEPEADDAAAVKPSDPVAAALIDDGSDPFSTIPGTVPLATSADRIKRRRQAGARRSGKPKPSAGAGAASGADSRKTVVGRGEDAVAIEDSDHEGDADALDNAHASVAAHAASGAEGGGGAQQSRALRRRTARRLPFSEFIVATGGSVPTWYQSYGPASIPVALALPATPPAATGGASTSDSAPAVTGTATVTAINAFLASTPAAGVAVSAGAATGTFPCPGHCMTPSLARMPSPAWIGTSFERAREIFKAAQDALLRGLRYFVVDGFVTDHVIAQEHMCKAWKYLSAWETDLKRQAAMQGRIVDICRPLLELLNPGVYIHAHKELSLEAAAAAQEQFDARLAKAEAKATASGGAGRPAAPSPADLASANEAAAAAIGFYAHFTRCYSDKRLDDAPTDARNAHLKPFEGATDLDDGSVEAYLTAHFCVARLLSRMVAFNADARLADADAACKRYSWIVAALPVLRPASADASTFFAREHAMCKEMSLLLPEKMKLMRASAAAAAAAGMGASGVRRA